MSGSRSKVQLQTKHPFNPIEDTGYQKSFINPVTNRQDVDAYRAPSPAQQHIHAPATLDFGTVSTRRLRRATTRPQPLGHPSGRVLLLSCCTRIPAPARVPPQAWEATQEGLRMESLRKTFGMAEPIRRGMELKITREGSWRPACLGGGPGPTGIGSASVHEDVLMGREASCDWEDVFTGDEQRGALGVQEEMERKLKI
ncbi:hypothetical protein CIB48_g3984 [Xylaria polymorpha]|nr:hypothetical protein CIB48_g3984 [Xylaria polymorpha]